MTSRRNPRSSEVMWVLIGVITLLVAAFVLMREKKVIIAQEGFNLKYNARHDGTFNNSLNNKAMSVIKPGIDGLTVNDVRLSNVLYQAHSGMGEDH